MKKLITHQTSIKNKIDQIISYVYILIREFMVLLRSKFGEYFKEEFGHYSDRQQLAYT